MKQLKDRELKRYFKEHKDENFAAIETVIKRKLSNDEIKVLNDIAIKIFGYGFDAGVKECANLLDSAFDTLKEE